MKKILALAAMAMFMGVNANAQLTEGETTSKTIKVGNRPQKGSFGIYMGASGEMINDLFNSNIEFKSMPLVNVKYMFTDRLEGRLGMQFYRKGETITGESTVTTTGADGADVTKTSKFSAYYLTTENRFYPGLAYHFSPKNLLDVYAGAELLVGWASEEDQVLDNDDNFAGGKGCMNTFQFGGGLFIGLQAFIGDLPLALGVEYGFHGYRNSGLSYKMETADGDKYAISAADFENLNTSAMTGVYDDLSASKSKFAQQVRVTLSYYFNR